MNDYNLMAIAVADYTGFILLIAMLVSSRIRRSAKRDEIALFTVIAFLSAVACVVDFITFYSDGRPGAINRSINLLGNTYCFLANPVFAACWCMYTEMKLYKSRARIRRRYKFVSIPAVFVCLLVLMNIFYPIVFYLDENNVYHRMPLSYLIYLVEFGYIIYSIIVIKVYESRYGKVRFFPVSLMMGPILLGSALQVIFFGISIMWVSLAIGLTSIYMAMQNEFSYLDTLTGLYNRAYLDYLLDGYAKDQNSCLGGIMIDVDYFKKINDTFGHSVGDEALIDTARVIQLAKPEKAMAIRFAGDEFIILLKNCNDESVKRVIENIRNEVALFNETEGRQYQLSLSIGYTLFDPDKDDTDSFFKHMDDNMYEEKVRKHSERK